MEQRQKQNKANIVNWIERDLPFRRSIMTLTKKKKGNILHSVHIPNENGTRWALFSGQTETPLRHSNSLMHVYIISQRKRHSIHTKNRSNSSRSTHLTSYSHSTRSSDPQGSKRAPLHYAIRTSTCFLPNMRGETLPILSAKSCPLDQ